METVRQVGMIALSCLGLYFVQKELNEELMGFAREQKRLMVILAVKQRKMITH